MSPLARVRDSETLSVQASELTSRTTAVRSSGVLTVCHSARCGSAQEGREAQLGADHGTRQILQMMQSCCRRGGPTKLDVQTAQCSFAQRREARLGEAAQRGR